MMPKRDTIKRAVRYRGRTYIATFETVVYEYLGEKLRSGDPRAVRSAWLSLRWFLISAKSLRLFFVSDTAERLELVRQIYDSRTAKAAAVTMVAAAGVVSRG